MTEINGEGLYLIEDGEVTHIHTSAQWENNLDALEEYIEEWELEVGDD